MHLGRRERVPRSAPGVASRAESDDDDSILAQVELRADLEPGRGRDAEETRGGPGSLEDGHVYGRLVRSHGPDRGDLGSGR